MVLDPPLVGVKIGVGLDGGELMARGRIPSVAPLAIIMHE